METENRQVWTNENQFLVCAAIKLILLTIFLYYISNWFILQPESTNNPNTTTTTVTINQTNTTTTKKQPKPKPQPTTPKPTQKHLFNSLLDFLVLHHDTCTPEDVTNPLKHRLPPPRHRNSSSNRVAEPKAPVVIYVAVVLLLTSLGAAFLEVYRAKGEPAKTETKMSRKCSLADLTVMRHHRKELVRRESILEEAPKSATVVRPLSRRSSFPVAPGDAGHHGGLQPFPDSRRTSCDVDFNHETRHIRLVRRC